MLPTVEQLKNLLIPRLVWYIDKRIAESGGQVTPGDDEITAKDIEAILNGTYTPVEDDDGVTTADIQEILSGNYTPVEDDDSWAASDFEF